ncbi:MAG: CoA-transferase [Thermodesulfobacteriota bacterium]
MTSGRKKLDKVTDLASVVNKYVTDGCSICLGGAIARESVAVAREIVRQQKKDLTLMGAAMTSAGEILVGAGCLKRIEIAYFWIGVVGQGFNFRRAVEQGVPRRPKVADYSNFSASLRFLAGSMGIGFMPTRSLRHSDIIRYNPDIKTMADPYTGQEVALVPAANPEVAFIHVQRADPSGNAVIMGNLWNDPTLARAARKTIITCEEIISEQEIRTNPNLTAIPRYCVEAVVPLPFGAHPEPVDGYYWMDQPFRRDFALRSQSREGFLGWLQEWVWDCADHNAYLEKLGARRIQALAAIEKRFRQGMAR